jgi:hypothetical protein
MFISGAGSGGNHSNAAKTSGDFGCPEIAPEFPPSNFFPYSPYCAGNLSSLLSPVMIANPPRMLVLSALVLLCGCGSPHPAAVTPMEIDPVTARQPADPMVHDNALNLLHDLLGQEKNVSKILLIKGVSPGVKQLIKNISAAADTSLKTVESFAPTNVPPDWDRLGLPPGEKAARAAMAKTKEHELLHASGQEFEFLLLMTQSEALGYGTELARAAAENEPEPARARELAAISNELNQLHADVLGLLRAHRSF